MSREKIEIVRKEIRIVTLQERVSFFHLPTAGLSGRCKSTNMNATIADGKGMDACHVTNHGKRFGRSPHRYNDNNEVLLFQTIATALFSCNHIQCEMRAFVYEPSFHNHYTSNRHFSLHCRCRDSSSSILRYLGSDEAQGVVVQESPCSAS